jgi:hypothetical protein
MHKRFFNKLTNPMRYFPMINKKKCLMPVLLMNHYRMMTSNRILLNKLHRRKRKKDLKRKTKIRNTKEGLKI